MKDLKLDKLLEWRCIGPFRGGRVLSVAGDPTNPAVAYFGACAGGVWKTDDAGQYWQCVSDGYFKTGSVGAIAVANSDPNVIYAGMGEATIRIDVSHGDGVYKSTDAGRSWQHMGLKETRHIGKIAVHPHNPDVAFVAALGHAHGTNPERGVYRTTDGGKTWDLVLHKSEKAGAVDVRVDVNNPRIVYATIWEAYRNNWQISSGGPDSGIWRSMDGGDTWEDLTGKNGLPSGLYGKTGIAPSPAQPGRVWALLESEKGEGLYISDNYGDKWEHVNGERELIDRSWYYIHVNADTQDPNTVYVDCFGMWRSIDGGKNFTQMAVPHGDCHDTWIDPNNNQHLIHADDGGACISFNGGASWSSMFNQPTAQAYHISTDNQWPYHVYLTQQDNSSLAIPSRSERGAIPWAAIYQTATGESGYIEPRPDDHNIVYVGAIGSSPGGGSSLQLYNHRTKQVKLIANWPEANDGDGAEADRYRFNWTYPIVISPHDYDTVYVGGSKVLKTSDMGHSWTEISPDLTRNDPDKLKPTGGPINRDSIGAETYCTVYSFAESAHEAGVLWAGSDDGLVHISKDGGENWTNITPSGLPDWAMVTMIELSPHDKATAYLTGAKYKLDDYSPYIFKTTDYGANWTQITNGIREEDYLRVIRCDPTREGLLYAGSETGVYVSFDDGENWQAFNLNLPVTPVYDLKIKDNDLIAGTHGRSIWILDDITPLHQLHDAIQEEALTLFKPRDTWRLIPPLFEGGLGGGLKGKNYTTAFTEITTYIEEKTPENYGKRNYIDVGKNPPDGVIIGYHLKAASAELKLEILDAAGKLVADFTTKPEKRDDMTEDEKKDWKEKLYAPAYAGMNRFIWDMRFADGTKIKGKEPAATTPRGSIVPPGTYQVRLTSGDVSQTHSFEVVLNPTVETSAEDMQAQADLLAAIRDKISECNKAVNTLRDLEVQVDGIAKRTKNEDVKAAAKALKARLREVEDPLIKRGNKTFWQAFNHGSRLIAKLGNLLSYVAPSDSKPTLAAHDHFDFLTEQVDVVLGACNGVASKEVAAFNQLLAENGVGGVIIS